MRFRDLKKRYAFNDRRRHLVEALECFAYALHKDYSGICVVVFGSFITKAEEPNDLDVLIHAVAYPGDNGFNRTTRLRDIAPEGIHAKGNLSSCMDRRSALKDARVLVEDFNQKEENETKGIRCESWVEVDFEP